jgi:c-di-GMP-binding flagellar brake protein YcgR
MSTPKRERRTHRRVPADLPVSIRPSETSPATTAHTRDVSTNGIFFYADARMEPGSELEIVLILPAELTQGEQRWVCCQATVVRVEEQKDPSRVGLAATIRNMQMLPEASG